jgi:hypothetical protein
MVPRSIDNRELFYTSYITLHFYLVRFLYGLWLIFRSRDISLASGYGHITRDSLSGLCILHKEVSNSTESREIYHA